ncbi:MAG: hypothetical protein JNJ83_22675 [Verrucomicrobiaceae bacterium]|nr:hypothetical protein [Verrucomicrobiaceae bacterium]
MFTHSQHYEQTRAAATAVAGAVRCWFGISIVLVLAWSPLSPAQQSGESGNIELLELKTTLEASARQIRELEAQLAASKVQITTLTQSVAAANSDAAQAREQFEKLRTVLEGLGIGALEGSRDQVQEKLLAALSDLRIVDDQKRNVTDALMALSEAALVFAKNNDASSKGALDVALSRAEEAVRTSSGAGTTSESATDLHNAKVVSWKPEAALTVLNVGSRQGVRVGMPFTLYRGEQPIAQVLVVDVRKSVCGAVVQESLAQGAVPTVGDRGQIDPNRAF